MTAFDRAPRYQDFALPDSLGPHEAVVDVLAVGLHPRVRSQTDGSHYTSTDELPLVPGIDGVARTPDGKLRYFILPHTRLGSMAEQTVVDLRRSVELPDGANPIQIAAAMNPAMSSWIALRRRIDFQPGQSVLIMGATGNAGRLAIQVAKKLGAGRVTAVGRGADRLSDLGADATVCLDGDERAVSQALGEAGRDVDVVIDYLWGQPTHDALCAIVPRRVDDGQVLTWIQIGSVAGLESSIPSAALRASRLQLVGSGQGSVSTRDIVAALA
ncbi:quinone oxidoreductase family protein [Spelaeicoccus albus]|uniref:NADPH:quinone reductase-like Zn-dependent oxidoreductase n=1 Tax=Spelaeicoccus albus TaxID=1280376 RepID=A0A7Z0D420_9MICO|nr:zinc-binding alcohol dehydrogenase family protein [Spelaeicoccus albus]NYI68492.1 NADPH:quinone reductase-like Zn-dependent oxidoreductase [Spelaeicoccus albus]